MATAGGSGAANFSGRTKPEVYRTVDNKLIVEDELLNFLVIKLRTLNHDDIVTLAANYFSSECIEASKKLLFELCPCSQRCVNHKGPQKDANNIKACLKLLNERGEDIPRFVSHFLDDLPPVSYDNIDVSALLGRLEQLSKDLCLVKRTLVAQTDACEHLRATTLAIDDRVAAIENPRGGRGGLPTRMDSAEFGRASKRARPAEDNAPQVGSVTGGFSGHSAGQVSTPQHSRDLCSTYDKIVNVLITSSKCFLKGGNKVHHIKPGWNEHVSELHSAARDAFKVWSESGRPRLGPIFDHKQATNAKYKYAVRFIKNNEDVMRADSLARKLQNNSCFDFWQEVKFLNNNKMALPSSIDGVSGAGNIADLWKSHYQELFNCVKSDAFVIDKVDSTGNLSVRSEEVYN